MLSLSSKDFTASYLALQKLGDDIRRSPALAEESLIRSLEALLEDKTHAGQTCASFLYRQAAEILGELMVSAPQYRLRQRAATALHHFAMHTLGDPCQAAAKALGSLPVRLAEPGFLAPSEHPLPELTLEEVVQRSGISPGRPSWIGRCLVLPDRNSAHTLVLKCASRREEAASLRKEAAWIKTLRHIEGLGSCRRFDIPCLLWPEEERSLISIGPQLQDNALFRTSSSQGPPEAVLPFTVHRDYFVYAQGSDPCNGVLPWERFREIMSRNSYLLGRLTAQGIVHTAPIPLFHNRAQQARRDDQGLYLWERRGRLDRWLASTLYPNFGLSGLRDFEHLEPAARNGSSLFRLMGAQILSLLLVCGSYFRLQEPQKVGYDASRAPIDVRYLFDTERLMELIATVFASFYEGFVGCELGEPPPRITAELAERMREELGVDRYMTELWRASDQMALRENEFYSFLRAHSYSEASLAAIRPGQEDIPLLTGPHLGEFNRSISLPELIDFTAGASAACISAKYLQDKGSLFTERSSRPDPRLD